MGFQARQADKEAKHDAKLRKGVVSNSTKGRELLVHNPGLPLARGLSRLSKIRMTRDKAAG